MTGQNEGRADGLIETARPRASGNEIIQARIFDNELGNRIHARVAYHMGSAPTMVSVRMSGPSTLVDHEYTRGEAIMLRDLLTEILEASA